MSIKLSKKKNFNNVGVAFADATVRQIGVSEFADNDLLSNTEVGFTLYFGGGKRFIDDFLT